MWVFTVLGTFFQLLSDFLALDEAEEDFKTPQTSRSTSFLSKSDVIGNLIMNNNVPPFSIEADEVTLESQGKYLIYLPYEGASNQFYCLIRALYLARQLSRTLLIPPLMPSRHDSIRGSYLDWRHIIDFSSIDTNSAIACNYKFISSKMIPQIKEMLKENDAHCFTYGRWRHFYVLGLTACLFAKDFDLTDDIFLDYHELPLQSDRNSTYLLQVFSGRSEVPLLCAANLQHLGFGNFMNTYLHNVMFSEKVVRSAWDLLHHVGIRNGRFGAVHWRRGDFALACKNKPLEHCWPDEEQLRSLILKVAKEEDIDVFIIGTNEKNVNISMTEDGIDIIQIQLLPLSANDPEEWTELAPVFIDTFLFSFCDFFIGNRYSTVSRSAIARRKFMGLENKTTTF